MAPRGWITDADLHKVAEDVLTGKISREELAARHKELSPANYLHMLAYVGVTLIWATRHRLDDQDRVVTSFGETLLILMYKGTQAESDLNDGIYGGEMKNEHLRIAAVKRGLYKSGERGQQVVLDPPDAIKELAGKHGDNPAVWEFMEAANLRDDHSPAAMRQDAKRIVARLKAKHGLAGLPFLLEEVRAALEK